MRIGTLGFGPHPWVSVERTRHFYARALRSAFELVDLDGEGTQPTSATPDVDATLSFHSPRWARGERHGDGPIVLAMHGGPVVDHPSLRRCLTHLRTDDTLLVNCSSDAAIVRGLCDGPTPRIVQLPLPVDTETMTPYDRGDCRRELELPPCDFVVGFVCRLVPQKNLHQFLRMFADIRARLRPHRVVALVVGSFYTSYPILDYGCGGYRDHIAELVQTLDLPEDLVTFPAQLDDDELAMAFGAMNVLVHPTSAVDENFGYVPVEAMACGTPVVGSAYGGLKDSIVPGQTGALMPTWATGSGVRIDLAAGVDAVVELLRDRAAQARMSDASAHHARTHYGEARCVENLREAVRGSIAAHARGETRPITTTAVPPAPRSAGLLPRTDPSSWESFVEPVRHYVSHATPQRVDVSTQVRWAAPLRADRQGRLRLHDPAWPAALPQALTHDPLRVACERWTRAGDLARPGTPRFDALQSLVDDGLLVARHAAAHSEVAA